ncbi:hypothetical protein [Virgibacillus sp. DJP39]|uniref:hypothetical protein n=1 Tax=Virgibacillus sp. DJP39 TaxID=3409790 RepID=UPI003BB6D8A6
MNEINEVLSHWFKDGCSTWRVRGAKDGDDGSFGGSFHFISDFKKCNQGYKVEIDFGSSDIDIAMEDLNIRLKNIGYRSSLIERESNIIIEKI